MRAASVYAARLKWAVVPLHDVSNGACSCGKPVCPSAGKHPRLTDWVEGASSDVDVIAEWARNWPRANPGIATGTRSGFWVLDVDPDKGGAESLAALVEQHGEIPVTAEQRTGSGGTHYLFSLPDFTVTNKAALQKHRGLDIRGDGGQIVVAPSVSSKGAYAWVRPPWSTPIAPAPEWLLELLRAPALSSTAPGTSTTERRWFPEAATAVLAAAAAHLAAHGPAIDGAGGGPHTVQAGAILTHDWALTETEAWPLFVEWNETCEPPWDLEGENSLREKLRNGLRYGKGEFGSRRSLDAVERAAKQINDWRASGTGSGGMTAMVEIVREISRHCGDPVRRALILADLEAATGLKPKDLALPKVELVREIAPVGSIEVTPALHEVADAAVKVIEPVVFQRSGVLCEIIAGGARAPTFISDLAQARIQDLMSRAARWVRNDGEKGLIQQAAPDAVARIVHARRSHARVRVLEAVTTAPIFLSDGSILSERGYNAQARVYLEPSVTVDVPDEPTLADAQHAVVVLNDLVSEYVFATPADRSAWLAGVLSPLVKSATGNAPAPLFLVTASSAGVGKTMLVQLAAIIMTGAQIGVSTYSPRDPGEWGKKLTSFVKDASPMGVFDNLDGSIGDEGLDRLLTSRTWKDRILGASEAPPLPVVTTWWGSGNNTEPVRDTVRRVLPIRLETDSERPQERTFIRSDLEGYALEYRSTYLSAALTILRAFHVAGRPSQNIPSWGSFPAWSELVRGALVWAGCADPFATQARAALSLNEPENDAHDFWLDVVGESSGTPASVCSKANEKDAQTVLGMRDSVNPHTLRKFIGRFVDKPRGRRRIRRSGDPALYRIEAVR